MRGIKAWAFRFLPSWLRRRIWEIDDRRVLLRDNNRFRFYADGAD